MRTMNEKVFIAAQYFILKVLYTQNILNAKIWSYVS